MRNIFIDGVRLSPDDWYMRLLHWMYGVEPIYFKSLCPLFWSVVGSILFLPLYCLIRFSAEFFFRVNKTKQGEGILKIVGYVAQWVFVILCSLMLTFVGCMAVSGLANWLFFGVTGELIITILVIMGGLVGFLLLFGVFLINDRYDEKKKEREREHGMFHKELKRERNLRRKRIGNKIMKPFRMFGYYISSVYHRVCPLIYWEAETF